MCIIFSQFTSDYVELKCLNGVKARATYDDYYLSTIAKINVCWQKTQDRRLARIMGDLTLAESADQHDDDLLDLMDSAS